MDQHDVKNFQIMEELDLIQPGDVLVDIGANIGDYTKYFLSKLRNTGQVFSVELDVDVFAYLRKTFEAPNLVLLNAAVCDKDGEIDYYVHNTYHQMNSISGGSDRTFRGKVKSATLDTILRDVEHISLLKIDIEGAEILAIDGMSEVLKKTSVIFLENHDDEGWAKIFPILTENGFICYNIETKKRADAEHPPYQSICVTEPERLRSYFKPSMFVEYVG
jgi:FkbM family methyltransferase